MRRRRIAPAPTVSVALAHYLTTGDWAAARALARQHGTNVWELVDPRALAEGRRRLGLTDVERA